MNEPPKRYDICVLGLGYIGLPTASVLATKGKIVLGVDVVERIVNSVNRGEVPIQEPDLDLLLRAAVQSGNLTAATSAAPADVYILAVPTPFKRDADNVVPMPDLDYVEAAARSLATVVEAGNLVILESTSPIGTTERIREWLLEEAADLGRDVSLLAEGLLFAHCPERVLPGQMLKELVSNDRIVGGLTPEASAKARKLYEIFCSAEILETGAREAELAKLAENAFRDVNIALANELSIVCQHLKLDVWEVIRLANHHPRVQILRPGPGVGGHCIAVDPWFIVAAAPDRTPLLQAARSVNDSKPSHVISEILRRAERFRNPVVACFGLTYKADVDDLRESPALAIVNELGAMAGHTILAVDPNVSDAPSNLHDRVKLVPFEGVLDRADILVFLVSHREFRKMAPSALQSHVIIDVCGLFSA